MCIHEDALFPIPPGGFNSSEDGASLYALPYFPGSKGRDVGVTEGQSSVDEKIESDPHGPNIRCLAVKVTRARQCFRSVKSRRSGRGFQHNIFRSVELATDTEVGNAQPSVTAEKQIGWLDVTMDDVIAMH